MLVKRISRLFCIVLVLSMMTTGCSDLRKKNRNHEQEKSERDIPVLCVVDIKKISRIFHENVKPELACLRENLIFYMKVVETDRKNALKKTSLFAYVESKFGDLDVKSRSILEAVYSLNTLINGGSHEYLTGDEIGLIINTLQKLNESFSNGLVAKYAGDKANVSAVEYLMRKEYIHRQLTEVGQGLIGLFETRPSKQGRSLDLKKMVRSFSWAISESTLKKIMSLLFLKKTFFGGDLDEVSRSELASFLEHLPMLFDVYFGVIYLGQVRPSIDKQAVYLQSIHDDVDTATNLLLDAEHLKPEKGGGVGLHWGQLRELFKQFCASCGNIDRYRDIFSFSKNMLFGIKNSELTYRQAAILLKKYVLPNINFWIYLSEVNAQSPEVFAGISNPEQIKESLRNVVRVEIPGRLMGFGGLAETKASYYATKLQSLLFTYPFLRHRSGDTVPRFLPRYGASSAAITRHQEDVKTNIRGGGRAASSFGNSSGVLSSVTAQTFPMEILATSIARDLLEIVVKKYGTQLNSHTYGERRYGVSKSQLLHIISKVSPPLVKAGTIPRISLKSQEKLADGLLLMSGLFVMQSNGNPYLEVPELVELLNVFRSADILSSSMYGFMRTKCGKSITDAVPAECYRNNFREFLVEQTIGGRDSSDRISRYLPGLARFIKTDDSDDGGMEYLALVESFTSKTTRYGQMMSPGHSGQIIGNANPSTLLTQKDFLKIWMGILVIEESVIRFDLNGNGILETGEARSAFEVYEPSILTLVPYDWLKPRAGRIFEYLLVHQRLPEFASLDSISDFFGAFSRGSEIVQFFLKDEDEIEIHADRKTFAEVLAVLSERMQHKSSR